MMVIIGAISLSFIIILYILLALGQPLGFLAMGGRYEGKLPDKMRVQVAISIPAQLFALYVMLKIGEVIGSDPSQLIRTFANVFMVYFLINTVMNLLSKSYFERMIMTPIALYLSFVYFYALYL
jgi:hypothetical protein